MKEQKYLLLEKGKLFSNVINNISALLERDETCNDFIPRHAAEVLLPMQPKLLLEGKISKFGRHGFDSRYTNFESVLEQLALPVQSDDKNGCYVLSIPRLERQDSNYIDVSKKGLAQEKLVRLAVKEAIMNILESQGIEALPSQPTKLFTISISFDALKVKAVKVTELINEATGLPSCISEVIAGYDDDVEVIGLDEQGVIDQI